ncbi:hypothetical protein [Cohnella herbarum]|uniref:Uncharacterized protein n=1 Tax=Cohnella herbarum TaxID=2728023 RepID=A0A7Z2ZKQ6_9BACL|nr:hypothetical protein [Cohnella herbarum]QJD83213.1 hypothetical protein HH215_08520 [Cohnella herbarum]
MTDQLTRAKQLFTSFDGNTFQMYREGRYEEYQQYNVPKETETDWFKEMVDHCSRELSIRDWQAVHRLASIASHYQDVSILRCVLSFATRNVMSSDSIVKLMYAEGILEIITKTRKQLDNDLVNEAYKSTYVILETIIKEPLIIDPGHELENYNLKDKKTLNDRARKSIEKIRSDLNG